MKTKTINQSVAQFLISETEGKFFTATFTTKDFRIRVLNGRLGVKKHLSGGTLKFSPSSKDLVTVYDVKSKGYRTINLNTLTKLKINGKVYNVTK